MVSVDPSILTDKNPTAVTYTVSVQNVLDGASVGDSLVGIDLHHETDRGFITATGTGWTVVLGPDTNHIWVSYSAAIPAGGSASPLTIFYEKFTLAGAPVTITTTIPAGSGGDTVATNNSASATVRLFV